LAQLWGIFHNRTKYELGRLVRIFSFTLSRTVYEIYSKFKVKT